jgi:hypothetical protein
MPPQESIIVTCLQDSVVGAMFVFEGLNSSCFSRLKLPSKLLFTGHYTIVAGTALSFDIGLGVLILALSFFIGGTCTRPSLGSTCNVNQW